MLCTSILVIKPVIGFVQNYVSSVIKLFYCMCTVELSDTRGSSERTRFWKKRQQKGKLGGGRKKKSQNVSYLVDPGLKFRPLSCQEQICSREDREKERGIESH